MKKGFTLIELLAGIVILGILAGLMVPNVIKMFTDAKKSSFITEANNIYKLAINQREIDIATNSFDNSYESDDDKLLMEEKDNFDYVVEFDSDGNLDKLCISNGEYIFYSDTVDLTSESISVDNLVDSSESCLQYEPEVNYTAESCFTFNSSTQTITGYDATTCGTDVAIPKTIGGVEVLKIGEWAFIEKELTKVKLPDTITSIGFGAFIKNNLKSVSIPSSVTSLGGGAFASNQFKTNPFIYGLTSSGEVDYTVLSSYAGSNRTNIVIPSTVKTIDLQAFTNCSITSIDIPANVETIGMGAFNNNPLTNINFHSGLKTIDVQAFWLNESLKSVVLPDTLETIGNLAFGYTSIGSITIPSSVENLGNKIFFVVSDINICVSGKSSSSDFTTYGEKALTAESSAVVTYKPGGC